MASIETKQKYSVVGASLLALLVVSVPTACGKNNGDGSLDDDSSSSSSGGGDASCTGFGCPMGDDDSGGSSSGLSSGGGVFSDDSGIVMVVPTGGPVMHETCTAGALTASQIKSLAAGGSTGSMKWLYPYDQTIFPGGIAPPVLQWAQSGTPDGMYVHIKSTLFDYTGCAKGVNPGQLALPELEWATAYAQSKGSSDPMTVELSTISGSTVSTVKETWVFAKGSLKGTIYYNTYNSPIAGNNGAVMSLTAGATAPTAVLNIAGAVPFGPCISCHSLSADGSMLAAQRHFYPGGLQAPGSMSFNLVTGPKIDSKNPMPLASDMTDDWGFSAVYPDGSLLLTAGELADSTMVTGVFPDANTNNPGMIGPVKNAMFDTKTGSKITFSGLDDANAMMPMFSPDGKHVIYNNITKGGGHALEMQDYDNSSHTFSNPKTIYTDAKNYPGWPFFTPDGLAVVFVMGPSSNFASIPPSSFGSLGPVQASAMDVTTSDLYITYLANPGAAIALDAANGFKGGNSYLPYPGRDEHLNFYPTVMPVSAGGYFWVFFTSRRQYGNLQKSASGTIPDDIWNSETKKIWAAAISIGQTTGDPSHPAFEFPGQELQSGNIRAFAVLSPCKGDGATCESGIDCCGGSCTMDTGKLLCGPPKACAGDGDRCSATTPCCPGSADQCIGGYCSFIAK